MANSSTYAIDDMHGNEICAGLDSESAKRKAQRLADERGETVRVYNESSPDDFHDVEPSPDARVVSAAIVRSISHDEIVTVEFDPDVETILNARCDGSGEGYSRTEFWGTTKDGDDWRVHMKHRS